MKTVGLPRASAEMQRILKAARKEDVVVRTAEGDEGLLTWIDDFAYEIAAQRRNKKLMAFLDQCGKEAQGQKGIPLAEVRKRLGLPAHSVNGAPPNQAKVKTMPFRIAPGASSSCWPRAAPMWFYFTARTIVSLS